MNISKSGGSFLQQYYSLSRLYGRLRAEKGFKRDVFGRSGQKTAARQRACSKRDFFSSSVAPLFLIDIFESLFLTDKHKYVLFTGEGAEERRICRAVRACREELVYFIGRSKYLYLSFLERIE